MGTRAGRSESMRSWRKSSIKRKKFDVRSLPDVQKSTRIKERPTEPWLLYARQLAEAGEKEREKDKEKARENEEIVEKRNEMKMYVKQCLERDSQRYMLDNKKAKVYREKELLQKKQEIEFQETQERNAREVEKAREKLEKYLPRKANRDKTHWPKADQVLKRNVSNDIIKEEPGSCKTDTTLKQLHPKPITKALTCNDGVKMVPEKDNPKKSDDAPPKIEECRKNSLKNEQINHSLGASAKDSADEGYGSRQNSDNEKCLSPEPPPAEISKSPVAEEKQTIPEENTTEAEANLPAAEEKIPETEEKIPEAEEKIPTAEENVLEAEEEFSELEKRNKLRAGKIQKLKQEEVDHLIQDLKVG